MKRKIVLISIAVAIAVTAILSIFLIQKKNHTPSKLELIKLNELSNSVMLYMDKVEDTDSKEIDKYISYALEYAYNENNENKLSIHEIKEIIDNTFTNEVTEKEIENIGITPLLLENNTLYDADNKEYYIDRDNNNYSDIASTKITKYLFDSAKKNGNKFIVTYKKYVVNNPYEVLNYYDNLNKQEKGKYDTEAILNYLKGKENVKTIKLAITDKNASVVGKDEKSVKVYYQVQDGKILIDSIKK